VWWNTSETYKNAVTNALYIRLTAALHNRIPGDTAWLSRSRTAWSWFLNSGMINSSGLVNDGLTTDGSCRNNGGGTFTYNQGVILDGLAQLSIARGGDSTLLAQAKTIAQAATTRLVANGVLSEPVGNSDCDSDDSLFKGIFVRNLYEYARDANDGSFAGFMATQASSILANDTYAFNQKGMLWGGASSPQETGYRCTASAQDALSAGR
jgi:predicted alpha-1,6-mannanase (GH76 family)